MNRQLISFVLSGLALLGGIYGCDCSRNYRSGYVYPPRRDAVFDNPFASNGPMPPRAVPAPPPGVPVPNPPAVAAPPPGAMIVPPGGIAPPGQAAPPPNAAIQQNNYIAPASPMPPTPRPPSAGPNVYLEQPQPAAPPSDTRTYTPQTPEPPTMRNDSKASPALPVDIPQFTTVKPNIAGGQEPLADGITWLKQHGYRSVLHVRAPGENDDEARKQYEQAGLRYQSLEVSPQTLTKETADNFNRLVGDKDHLPLFVYDKDGSLAGALWYLHFRLVDRATADKAREEAERLGFKPERGDAFVEMWLAVQKLLKDLNP